MDDGQWIGGIVKLLHLVDEKRRKLATGRMVYASIPGEMRDMMRRYDVAKVE